MDPSCKSSQGKSVIPLQRTHGHARETFVNGTPKPIHNGAGAESNVNKH